MAIFSRKTIAAIIGDEGMTAEEKTEQVFSLHGKAVESGYISKIAAEAAKAEAIETAKAEAVKGYEAPDPKDSEAYKTLQGQFDAYKTRQEARTSAEFASVKPKFFDAVYDRLDHADGAKPVKEQLEEIQKNYEEYFTPAEQPKPAAPQFGAQANGEMPKGEGDGSFAKYWGYKRKE